MRRSIETVLAAILAALLAACGGADDPDKAPAADADADSDTDADTDADSDTDADCEGCASLADGEWEITGDPRFDGVFAAVLDIDANARATAAGFRADVIELGALVGIDGDELALEDLVAEVKAAIEAEISACVEGSLTVTSQAPLCTVDIPHGADQLGWCEAGMGCDTMADCSEGDVPVACDGLCIGACSGECTELIPPPDGAACAGDCAGECTGSCIGVITPPSCCEWGECVATDDCNHAAYCGAWAWFDCDPPELTIDYTLDPGLDPDAAAECDAVMASFTDQMIAVIQRTGELGGQTEDGFFLGGIDSGTTALATAIEQLLDALVTDSIEPLDPDLACCLFTAIPEALTILETLDQDMDPVLEGMISLGSIIG